MSRQAHVVFVGGGLAGGLAAYRLAQLRPDANVLVLERNATVGGAHTWCLHESDGAAPWLAPFVAKSWDGYDVRFPRRERRFSGRYHALRSAPLHQRVTAALGTRLRFGVDVDVVDEHGVRLATGETIDADLVIDSRGALPFAPCAWQKFHGLFVRTEQAHGLARPRLMDATVAQEDGFRFMYLLPFNEHELLVEDTHFSDTRGLDAAAAVAAIQDYGRAAGLGRFTVTGEESGALPIPLLGAQVPKAPRGVAFAGVRAGLYHPTTGYSLPEAVRFADWLATRPVLTGRAVAAPAAARAAAHWRRGAFCRRLNNMLFRAAAPAARLRVMEQFYGRDAALIARFYGGTLTAMDQLRLVTGRPPVPLARGLRAFFGGEVTLG